MVIFHKTPFYLPDYYTLTAPVAHLLSLVSGVQEEYVKNLHVMEKGLGKELPWYPLSSKADKNFHGILFLQKQMRQEVRLLWVTIRSMHPQ